MENIKEKLIEYFTDQNSLFAMRSDKFLLDSIMNETMFLDSNASTRQRIWHIMNENCSIPNCKECNNIVKWSKVKNIYSVYCSASCSNKSNITKSKAKQTIQDKYGVDSYTQSDDFKSKAKQTIQDKYGVDSYTQSDDFKSKAKQTIQDKYGVDSYTQSDDYLTKIKKTNLERYGVGWWFQTEAFKDKSKRVLLEKYGVDNSFKSKEIQQKQQATMVARYGSPYYGTSYLRKIASENYHKIHNDIRLTAKQYELLHNKEWLVEQNYKNKLPLYEIAKALDCDITTVSNYFKMHNIDIIYTINKSNHETNIIKRLESIDKVFIQSNRNVIAPFELDIYFPNEKLAIELCGIYWHSEKFKNKNYHKMKYDMCKEKGIRLLTIFEDEWLAHENIIINKIKYMLNVRDDSFKKVYARKTICSDLSINVKKHFFDNYHIQKNCKSSIHVGLEFNNELVAAMAFTRSSEYVTIERYCTKYNVIGGFSKLLKYVTEKYNIKKIITFADLRWSEGDLYKNNGFELDKILPPDYSYFHKSKRYHKFNFRHKTLKKIFENYDEKLSEHENCLRNNCYRIYDCGKLRFVKQ